MRMLHLLAIAAVALSTLPSEAAPPVRRLRSAVVVEQITYHGWQGAYRLTNRVVDLVLVPQIGRIMRYGFVGGPNLLWENAAEFGRVVDPPAAAEWTNFGGDKLWVAPQWKWRGDQDPYLDAGACKVTILPGPRLRIAGPVSPNYNLRFVREIRLSAVGSQVTLHNTLINEGSEKVDWSIWEVTQVDNPDSATLPLTASPSFPLGYSELSVAPAGAIAASGGVVTLHRAPTRAFKLGSASRLGYAAMHKAGVRMVVDAAFDRYGRYPDGGCAQEIYSNPDPLRYMELELLSPMHRLAKRESAEFVTRWHIERRW